VTTTASHTTVEGDERRFIAFGLADAIHALPADQVREVIGMVIITPLPDAPEWVTGIINVRGTVVPVIDLRVRVGVRAAPLDLSTPILIVEHDGRSVGLIADAIDQIITVPASAIQPPDELMRQSPLIASVVRHGSRLLVVMNLAAICAGTDQFTEPPA
jgi:purine-binding chemotaxis protein CheW